MKKKLIKLIDLKTIITLAMTVGLNYGFFMGKISPQEYLIYVALVFSFYFNKKKDGE